MNAEKYFSFIFGLNFHSLLSTFDCERVLSATITNVMIGAGEKFFSLSDWM